MVSSERFWILVLAATAFCAGLAAGVYFSLGRLAAPEPRPFQAFEARMVASFDLDEEHQRYLRYILKRYDQRIEELKSRSVRDYEPQLIKEGREHRELIRRHVVPQQSRREFDLWSDPTLVTGP